MPGDQIKAILGVIYFQPKSCAKWQRNIFNSFGILRSGGSKKTLKINVCEY